MPATNRALLVLLTVLGTASFAQIESNPILRGGGGGRPVQSHRLDVPGDSPDRTHSPADISDLAPAPESESIIAFEADLLAGVSSHEGTLFVYPVEIEVSENGTSRLLILWDDVARDSLFVYSRALERRRDIGLALRHLERDLVLFDT